MSTVVFVVGILLKWGTIPWWVIPIVIVLKRRYFG